MPLTKDPVSVVCEDCRVGIGFTMLDDTKKVAVWVDKGALGTLLDKSEGSTERAVFDRYCETLETIASSNYDAGIIEIDGSTIIRRDDVEGLG